MQHVNTGENYSVKHDPFQPADMQKNHFAYPRVKQKGRC